MTCQGHQCSSQAHKGLCHFRFYKLRVESSSGGRKVMTAIPARCLLGAQEQLTGAITPSGDLISLSYASKVLWVESSPVSAVQSDTTRGHSAAFAPNMM